jgi:hypothetical protein
MRDTFCATQLRHDLDELYDLLAELLEIDLVLDGLEAHGCLTPSPGFVQGARSMTVGRTEPFEVHYYDTTGQPLGSAPDAYPTQRLGLPAPHPGLGPIDMGFLSEAGVEAQAFREAARSTLDQLVDPLLTVRSSELRSVAGLLVELYLTLDVSFQDDFAGLRNEGADWEGDAADAFFDGFYEPLVQIRANHLWAIDYLTSLTAHLKAVNDLGQQSLTNLVGCAIEVTRDQLHQRHQSNRGPSAASTLALLTAVTGVVGAVIFPVAGAAAATLGTISYVLGYAASQVPADVGEAATITAGSAREVHTRLLQHVHAVVGTVHHGYDESHDHARSMRETIASLEVGAGTGAASPSRVGLWLPRQPDLAPGPGFFHETSGRGL